MKKLATLALITATVHLIGCGGSSSTTSVTPTNTKPNTTLACPQGKTPQGNSCVALDNYCTPEIEKAWIYDYMQDEYLWYKEIPQDINPTQYLTASDYFKSLLVTSKDRFSFTMTTAEADAYFDQGIDVDYGIKWDFNSQFIRIAFVEPDSPAEKASVARGDYLAQINGIDITQLDYNQLINGLYPKDKDIPTAFTFYKSSTNSYYNVTLAATDLTHDPVPYTGYLTTSDAQKVGYLLFNDHIATASSALANNIDWLQQQNITDLILDLRYNHGGYLYIASQLASMINNNKTKNKIFTHLTWNDKHHDRDTDQPFLSIDDNNQELPHLNLNRLFVLTSPETCSASEALINGLSPFIPVIRIGGTTCGKPYGFQSVNNCATAYFAINFKGANSQGQEVPTLGFSPTCVAEDDLNFTLSDSREQMLSTALYYQKNGSCPTTGLSQSNKGIVPRSSHLLNIKPWQHNMLLRH